MSSLTTHDRGSLLRSYLLEAKCEFLRMLREPAYCVPVIAFPALFYLLFGVLLNRGSAGAAEYLLATYGVFGVAGAGMFGFGVTVAMDRERGFLTLKQVMPVPPGAMLLAKMAMAMVFALAISLVLAALAATAAGVSLQPWQWAGLWLSNVVGVLPFCAIGMYIGTLTGANGAPVVLNMLYLPMAFLSGLWLPLSMLPDVLSKIAPIWPSFHLGQIALKIVGHDMGGALWMHLLVLAAFTVAFFLFAQRRLGAVHRTR